ncbi:XRE family transcriptional regulator [Pedobacter alluvionis]|uniref:DNA-binding XRE family transcriptional regulator n=1 Tax=Pedobacter alluvionis TaxID=475253 RepID=A0A497XYV1_9SPHI|nr:LexA family transcriptional regulator [Pedobacter alluvionis]RLJ75133.1 DNA-binding XRE family transcriptional regulator [Pedobacter alluvionis]TFB30237.1 LexA family transcriptional regulator [Pedobacter alluvionis]
MLILAKNLKHLREKVLKTTQHKLADKLLVTRASYEKYENNKVQPSIETLLRISKLYHISVDILLTVEISKYSLDELLKLPDNRILLPIIVDNTGENKIEIIPYKASMGYISGYADPGYIESLQYMSLPFLRNGKYRAFPAEGDSMPPFQDGTYLIGDYVESIADIKVDKTYLLVLQSGFVYKSIEQINKDSLTVRSKNSFYETYDIPFSDILEVWKFVKAITDEHDLIDLTDNGVKEMFWSLKEDMKRMEKRLLHKPDMPR